MSFDTLIILLVLLLIFAWPVVYMIILGSIALIIRGFDWLFKLLSPKTVDVPVPDWFQGLGLSEDVYKYYLYWAQEKNQDPALVKNFQIYLVESAKEASTREVEVYRQAYQQLCILNAKEGSIRKEDEDLWNTNFKRKLWVPFKS